MCTLVTRDIFILAIEDDPANAIYNVAEMDRLVSEENLAVVREDEFLDKVYGAKSSLVNDEWLEQVTTTAAWIFDP